MEGREGGLWCLWCEEARGVVRTEAGQRVGNPQASFKTNAGQPCPAPPAPPRPSNAPVALPVGGVVLLVVGHQVGQREAVVRDDKVDGVVGLALVGVVQVRAARQARGKLGLQAAVAAAGGGGGGGGWGVERAGPGARRGRPRRQAVMGAAALPGPGCPEGWWRAPAMHPHAAHRRKRRTSSRYLPFHCRRVLGAVVGSGDHVGGSWEGGQPIHGQRGRLRAAALSHASAAPLRAPAPSPPLPCRHPRPRQAPAPPPRRPSWGRSPPCRRRCPTAR